MAGCNANEGSNGFVIDKMMVNTQNIASTIIGVFAINFILAPHRDQSQILHMDWRIKKDDDDNGMTQSSANAIHINDLWHQLQSGIRHEKRCPLLQANLIWGIFPDIFTTFKKEKKKNIEHGLWRRRFFFKKEAFHPSS